MASECGSTGSRDCCGGDHKIEDEDLDAKESRRMTTCVLLVGRNGKMVETYVGDAIWVTTVDSAICNATAYVDGFTANHIKVVAGGHIVFYLPKNLAFVKKGKRDGTVPVVPYHMETAVLGVVSVPGDNDSV